MSKFWCTIFPDFCHLVRSEDLGKLTFVKIRNVGLQCRGMRRSGTVKALKGYPSFLVHLW